MQIVIPMSGFGERFRRAGYDVPKPLIVVEGKPVIAHVIDLFPGETDFVFICNQDHLDEPAFAMRETLMRYCPTGKIVAIAPHKLGPVNAVLMAANAIAADRPVIINYCDFFCLWDYPRFKTFVAQSQCDGAIACYSGFHPHMMHSVNYAYVRERGGWIEDVREKRPFTDTPMEECASSGTYYFKSGALALDACRATVQRVDLALNGEYYVSLAYKPLLEAGRRVAVFEIDYFMQWGTPEDLADYVAASSAFARLAAGPQRQPAHAGAVMIPMAGAGSRFAQAGYALPKPLTPVAGRIMAAQATLDMPKAPQRIFVLRHDLSGLDQIRAAMENEFPGARFVIFDRMTDGQARTCLLAMDGVDLDAPLTIGACDNGVLYDADAFSALMADPGADVIVWGARGHPGARRHPKMYGWIDADTAGRVHDVSVKTPLADPAHDPIVIGAFTFKRAGDFVAAAERLIARDGRINGEFYVDSALNDCIALGLNLRLFETFAYLCWGTPEDLKTFEYWQGCFSRWAAHPYIHAPT